MIKLTNAEASAFFSTHISKLMADPQRPFPIADAFRLADIMQCIQSRIEPYRLAIKKIVEENKGTIDQNGFVNYSDEYHKHRADLQILELNAVTIEYPCDALVPSDGWPNLTISEALILKPILSRNGTKPPKNDTND